MPALAPVVDTLDTVPEPARQFYEQRDGKYHVILAAPPAGYVPAADHAAANGRLVEFRDKNILLMQENDKLKPLAEQFKDIDPVAARAALAQSAELGKKGVTKADDITALMQSAIEAALQPVLKKLDASTAEVAAERKRADESVLRSQVAEKFLKAGGKPKAVDYIVKEAAATFHVVDGAVKALSNKFSADKPGEAIGIEEWLVQASKEHDFAFEVSTGGGARPAVGGGAGKPGQTILRDPTPQQLGENAKAIRKGTVRVEYSGS